METSLLSLSGAPDLSPVRRRLPFNRWIAGRWRSGHFARPLTPISGLFELEMDGMLFGGFVLVKVVTPPSIDVTIDQGHTWYVQVNPETETDRSEC